MQVKAADTWYYIWAISDGTTVAGLLSTSATAPTLPGGYVYQAMIGTVRNDSASDFRAYHQQGKRIYTEANTVINNTNATSYTALDISGYVPPNAVEGSFVLYAVYGTSAVAASKILYVSPKSDGWGYVWARTYRSGTTYIDTNTNNAVLPMLTPGTVWYRVSSSNGNNVYLYVNGYTLP